MDLTPREIATVFKLMLVVIFGGMSLIFRLANRKEDARRMDTLRELERAEATNPVVPENLPPLERLRLNFSTLFRLSADPRKRGELLEKVFNQLFALGDVSVGCPFERRSDETGRKIDQQIDGVIELDANLYLVEIRWEDAALAAREIQKHVKMISGTEEGSPTRGVIVSFNGFTDGAMTAAKEALKAGHMVMLCTLADFTHIVEGEGHVDAFLRTRVHAASFEKNPYASYSYEAPPAEYEFS